MIVNKTDSCEDKIRRIAGYYGYDIQSRICIEEMAELTQAINKYWRKVLQCREFSYCPCDGHMPDGSEEYDNIVEELADVQIMIWQMNFLLSVANSEKIITMKLDRQLKRIKEN